MKSDVPAQNTEEYMGQKEIKAWPPYTEFPPIGQFKKPLKERMKGAGQWSSNQAAGRRWSVGCVSLEITQRCNLDCTLCYLSDSSEAVKDIPLQEIFRRIDTIFRHYGPHTDIQISGGDPTLRDRDELIQIVKRIRAHNMECSLFTNGILATRDLLKELAEAGMSDVALHVDLTQERNGYETEKDLNKIRLKYIKRAKGLGLNIFFNTTVFAGNFKEIPDLIKFFRTQSADVDMCSFQLQAEQGRGVLRERDFIITQQTVVDQIEKGAETSINFDIPMIGHPKCNKKAIMYEINGNLYNLSDKKGFVAEMARIAPTIERTKRFKTGLSILLAAVKRPRLWLGAAGYLFDLLKVTYKDLFKARGKVNKLSFFVHNFMDACRLEKERIDSCVFMVATPEGPMSMCMHNAKRDDYILQPLKIQTESGEKVFDPLKGELQDIEEDLQNIDYSNLPIKELKGRLRKEAVEKIIEERRKQKADVNP